MTVVLDGSLMQDRESVHAQLQERLSLPDCYGKNLDALYELLSEWNTAMKIKVVHWGSMEERLGLYAEAFAEALYDAASANPNLEISIH